MISPENIERFNKNTQKDILNMSNIKKKVVTTLLHEGTVNPFLKYISTLPNFDSLELLKIVPLSNVAITKGNQLTGSIVFKVKKNRLALPMLNVKDLCSGISAYKVQMEDDFHLKSQKEIDDKLQSLRDKILSFEDKTKRDFEDHSVHRNRNVKEYISKVGLGEKNCSITLEKYSIGKEVFLLLIIRSYHELSNQKLRSSIDENSTFERVFNSREYKDAVMNSKYNRNALAFKICKTLGLKCDTNPYQKIHEEKFEMCKPVVEDPFNFIKEDGNEYYFYNNCFSTDSCIGGILFGICRTSGYIWLNRDDKTWENPDFFNALPLGVMKVMSKESRIEKYGNTNPYYEKDKKLAWGGHYPYNSKSYGICYITTENKKKELLQLLEKYNYDKEYSTKKLQFIASYISSDDPEELSLGEILTFSNPNMDYVDVPVNTLGRYTLNSIHDRMVSNPTAKFADYYIANNENETGRYFRVHRSAFQTV
jgi:hypothetical protein